MKIINLSSTFTLYLQERNLAKHYKSFTKCNILVMERSLEHSEQTLIITSWASSCTKVRSLNIVKKLIDLP